MVTPSAVFKFYKDLLEKRHMKTHYYCGECDIFFYDENEGPNINRVHNKCGTHAKLLKHTIESESEED